MARKLRDGLTTSQFVTAPKLSLASMRNIDRLTTSQFVTAPKRLDAPTERGAV